MKKNTGDKKTEIGVIEDVAKKRTDKKADCNTMEE